MLGIWPVVKWLVRWEGWGKVKGTSYLVENAMIVVPQPRIYGHGYAAWYDVEDLRAYLYELRFFLFPSLR